MQISVFSIFIYFSAVRPVSFDLLKRNRSFSHMAVVVMDGRWHILPTFNAVSAYFRLVFNSTHRYLYAFTYVIIPNFLLLFSTLTFKVCMQLFKFLPSIHTWNTPKKFGHFLWTILRTSNVATNTTRIT